MNEGVHVTLPGGLMDKGTLERSIQFMPVTGQMELALIESASSSENVPERITRTLACVLCSQNGAPLTRDSIRNLSVADRQFLSLQLAILLEGNEAWLTLHCSECKESIDLSIERSSLPIESAGLGYPYGTISIGDHAVKLRVLTGADQERVAELDYETALHQLLSGCIVEVDGSPPNDDFIQNLLDDDIALIDEKLDEISPSMGTQIVTTCPACQHECLYEINPYQFGLASRSQLFQEIHTLASSYHWSETEILDLPRNRRKVYLSYIDQARGLIS